MKGGKVHLLAIVDNRVFPQDWQRPTMNGVSVGHRTTVVKTMYGAHPRLANTLTENAWGQLSAMVYRVDCCAIGECGLHYTEPLPSLPARRRLLQRQIVMAQDVRKPLVLHLRAGKGHPISAVMWETLTMLKQNSHRQQLIGMFPNTVFGVTVKTTRMPGYSH